jgi:hypothetical protein
LSCFSFETSKWSMFLVIVSGFNERNVLCSFYTTVTRHGVLRTCLLAMSSTTLRKCNNSTLIFFLICLAMPRLSNWSTPIVTDVMWRKNWANSDLYFQKWNLWRSKEHTYAGRGNVGSVRHISECTSGKQRSFKTKHALICEINEVGSCLRYSNSSLLHASYVWFISPQERMVCLFLALGFGFLYICSVIIAGTSCVRKL